MRDSDVPNWKQYQQHFKQTVQENRAYFERALIRELESVYEDTHFDPDLENIPALEKLVKDCLINRFLPGNTTAYVDPPSDPRDKDAVLSCLKQAGSFRIWTFSEEYMLDLRDTIYRIAKSSSKGEEPVRKMEASAERQARILYGEKGQGPQVVHRANVDLILNAAYRDAKTPKDPDDITQVADFIRSRIFSMAGNQKKRRQGGKDGVISGDPDKYDKTIEEASYANQYDKQYEAVSRMQEEIWSILEDDTCRNALFGDVYEYLQREVSDDQLQLFQIRYGVGSDFGESDGFVVEEYEEATGISRKNIDNMHWRIREKAAKGLPELKSAEKYNFRFWIDLSKHEVCRALIDELFGMYDRIQDKRKVDRNRASKR